MHFSRRNCDGGNMWGGAYAETGADAGEEYMRWSRGREGGRRESMGGHGRCREQRTRRQMKEKGADETDAALTVSFLNRVHSQPSPIFANQPLAKAGTSHMLPPLVIIFPLQDRLSA
jgi:hypothetical protein